MNTEWLSRDDLNRLIRLTESALSCCGRIVTACERTTASAALTTTSPPAPSFSVPLPPLAVPHATTKADRFRSIGPTITPKAAPTLLSTPRPPRMVIAPPSQLGKTLEQHDKVSKPPESLTIPKRLRIKRDPKAANWKLRKRREQADVGVSHAVVAVEVRADLVCTTQEGREFGDEIDSVADTPKHNTNLRPSVIADRECSNRQVILSTRGLDLLLTP
ncbi:unnamed protein product [Linum trigynum]|uniref:Uncharacterized protein n=1 Tax=Linum trigynum TaxID=586398 RepID=A0AAV2GAW8_9ROSI